MDRRTPLSAPRRLPSGSIRCHRQGGEALTTPLLFRPNFEPCIRTNVLPKRGSAASRAQYVDHKRHKSGLATLRSCGSLQDCRRFVQDAKMNVDALFQNAL